MCYNEAYDNPALMLVDRRKEKSWVYSILFSSLFCSFPE